MTPDPGQTAAAERPWWTDADQADLDVLVGELVALTYGRPWTDGASAAARVVLEFREARLRLSRAVWLRQAQNVADTETLVAHYVAESRARWWPEDAP